MASGWLPLTKSSNENGDSAQSQMDSQNADEAAEGDPAVNPNAPLDPGDSTREDIEDQYAREDAGLSFEPRRDLPKHRKRHRKQYDKPNRDAALPARRGFVVVYVDDLIIFSATPEEHFRHLMRTFEVLSDENLHINVEKSHFFTRFVRYLGCVCGEGQLFMDPDKVEAINRVHVTKHLASIRSFLGMTGFYRRWILGYAHITTPLAGLL